jgi:hypothetical protein
LERRHTVRVDEPEYVDDFICTCGVEPDANEAVADHLRSDARRILEAGTDGGAPERSPTGTSSMPRSVTSTSTRRISATS